MPHSTADTGELASRGPCRGKGAPGQRTAEGQQGMDSEPWPPVHATTADSGASCSLERDSGGPDRGEALTGRAGCGRSARPDARPGKADVFSRRQSCRGKNRKPRSWRAGRRETKGLKPLDNLTWRVSASCRAVTTVNARWPRQCVFPEAEPASVRAKAARLVAVRLTWRVAPAGWLATVRQQGRVEQLEKPSSSRPERAEAG